MSVTRMAPVPVLAAAAGLAPSQGIAYTMVAVASLIAIALVARAVRLRATDPAKRSGRHSS